MRHVQRHLGGRRGLALALPALALAWLALACIQTASGASGPCAPPVVNPVACENSLPGDPPSDWQVTGAGDPSIQGFATQMSVNAGQTVYFKIDTPSTAYHIDILRLGWYGGDGARKIVSGMTPAATLPQSQPSCLTDPSTGLIDCGNWAVSASWNVPATAVSGIYIAHLVRDDPADPGGSSQIIFVVRNDASRSDVLFSTSDETWEAYNDYGGNSLYTCTVACPPGSPLDYKGAFAVSYNRPFDGGFAVNGGASDFYYAEYQMVRWLERNGYDVSYTSQAMVTSSPSLLLQHRIFMQDGHDEYWSADQRASVLAARDRGVDLAFLTGNEIFWKTRWATSTDGSNTPYRTLICYKETHFNAPTDPSDPPTWTGAWADPRFSPPADGANPANALTGQEFAVNSGTSDIKVPYRYAKLALWSNTAVARLAPGQSVTLDRGGGTLGYEWDVDADNGFRPAGELDLSSTTVANVQLFTDYGSLTANGTATHNLTLYRAASGALVFGAGTVQWSWGLDNANAWGAATTDPSGNPPDPTMEQFTVNLLAEMGAQPSTLIPGLVRGVASTVTTPPTSTIASPIPGATVADGAVVTIRGGATAASGAVVAGVEVSTDGGSSWHPARLTGPDGSTVGWTYRWIAHGSPSTRIESRAVDDSANLEPPSDGETVDVKCPCSIWGTNVRPPIPDAGDTSAAELGVAFQSKATGQIRGIRFYKSAANTGTHVGSLWTASGTLLASATFTNETTTGWQTVHFSSPVTIAPDTTYVAGYFDPNGHEAGTDDYFYPLPAPSPLGGSSYLSPPLEAVPDVDGRSPNGLYSFSSSPTFPTSTFEAANYWVDVIFTPARTA